MKLPFLKYATVATAQPKTCHSKTYIAHTEIFYGPSRQPEEGRKMQKDVRVAQKVVEGGTAQLANQPTLGLFFLREHVISAAPTLLEDYSNASRLTKELEVLLSYLHVLTSMAKRT
ncbi:hypothetical protein WJX75_010007 [Coccomyxa subellipsoidea]|uniref:Uncharacterized protein n=1 Tax=Coccomyxa subellipsoidea TaxID=248742 RepID=A0ABR2YT98_9CHLO